MLLFFIFTVVFWANICVADDFSDVTNSIADNRTGVIAAFGDFNADKLVDIFVIDSLGETLYVLNATSRSNQHFDAPYVLYNSTSPITGIILADFDSDALMDILVLSKSNTDSQRVAVRIIWGNPARSWFQFDSVTFLDEPVLFDYNADMLPDLLVEYQPGNRSVWLATLNSSFEQMPITAGSTKLLRVPGSAAFIDLSDIETDYAPDLFLATLEGFEVYPNGDVQQPPTKQPTVDGVVGAYSFGDFNRDGVIDVVVPTCVGNDDAKTCSITAYNTINGDPVVMPVFGGDFRGWTFVNTSHIHFSFPATLHVGDYDMDGYPDLLTVLDNGSAWQPFLLHNVPSSSNAFGRVFQLEQPGPLSKYAKTLTATFYDIDEDGTLDIVLSVVSSDVPKLVFLRNNLAGDTCFLKVTVITGYCSISGDCPDQHRQPYGVNVAGPTVKYNTTTTMGDPQRSAAGQLSQSTHFALQLPYVVFGLGQTPNFVDGVGVGIPRTAQSKSPRWRVWQQIIPNSQLIVVAKPPDKPDSWQMKLFVTPSHQIVLTSIALTATCVLVAAIVLGLHLHEKREDSKEKKQESQKFHFDAM